MTRGAHWGLMIGLAWALIAGIAGEAGAQGYGDGGLDARAQAQKDTKYTESGTLQIEATVVAIGVSVTWGEGTLTFQDGQHRFKVNGLGLVGVGITKGLATGKVFNLEKLADFEGQYGGISASGTLIESKGGGITMRNGKGVYISMTMDQKGAKFTLGGGGMRIELLDD